MASLIRPLNRALLVSKQLTSNRAVVSALSRRLKSSDVTPKDSLNKPIQKQNIEEGVDPKESCKFRFSTTI